MSTLQVSATNYCSCGSIGRTDLRQCQEHFHIWSGDKRLASVGRIVYGSFPLDPSIPADVLENAKDRGSQVDRLFADWLRGNLRSIPAGTREDAKELFYKLQRWFDKQNFSRVDVQVLLGATDHGGILDFRFDGVPVDLKCTYSVEHAARLQVAGYVALDGKDKGYILHVTERYKEPRYVPLQEDDFGDWATMLAHWRMVQKRLTQYEHATHRPLHL